MKYFILQSIKCIAYILSFLVFRNDRIWVFGSFGVFNDNSRYLYEYINTNHKNIRSIWISSNRESVLRASEIGEAYYLFSLKGIFYSLIAKVYIYSAYVSDICWFASGGAIKVNLWHGIPLKKIEHDIKTKPLSNIYENKILNRIKYPHAHIKHDIVLSPSSFVTEYSFLSAFRVVENNIVTATYPRVLKLNDILSSKKQTEKFQFLYAPTWRDSGYDFIVESGIDFEAINELMYKLNAKLKLKLHSATKLEVNLTNYENLMLVGNQEDPQELLAHTDCLITDYSSIYFDYLFVDKPIIFFSFDKNAYFKNREFYFEYEEYTPGTVANSFEELIVSMEQAINAINDKSDDRLSVRNKFIIENEGNEMIYNKIVERINA
ncbi:CDP-glycerol glycerophosphotransferase family protein [Vibrio cholerae]|uniref:CDP-glycerol glycerophosphotransferase family protein n=1 Tax=Vibrio cholerae TaxID=666 RepID=UPI002FE52878